MGTSRRGDLSSSVRWLGAPPGTPVSPGDVPTEPILINKATLVEAAAVSK